MKCHKEVDHRKSSPKTVLELKKTALRLRNKKIPVKEIVEITGLAAKTVRQAFAAYDSGGFKAIEPKKRGRKPGEKRTLNADQEKAIIKVLLDHTPDQFQFNCCLWTRDTVRALIHREYGMEMPVRTVGEYLRRWGFTVQRPAKRAVRQDSETVQEWLEQTYPKIHTQAKQEQAEIFWGDETAVQNVAHYARGYAFKGKTPVLTMQTEKMHINMISAISNNGKLHFLLYSEAIDADRLIGFMEKLVHDAGRKIFLILDNLRVHHSKKVHAWEAEHQAELTLFHLPPYSPEYNPDEYLNHDLKRTLGTQAMVKNKQELHSRAESFMNALSSDPEHVKAYFEHPVLHHYKL